MYSMVIAASLIATASACSLLVDEDPAADPVDAAPDAGACGVCDEATPLCAPDSQCVACIDHEDCLSGICDPFERACAAVEDILHVDPIGLGATPCGTPDEPCNAMNLAEPQISATKRYMLITGRVLRANAGMDRTAGMPLIIVGGPGAEFAPAPQQSAVTVFDGSHVLVDRIALRGRTGALPSEDDGVNCRDSTVRLRRVTIESFGIEAVDAFNCDVIISESTITSNAGGVFINQAAAVQLVNNVIVRNGSSSHAFGGVRITSSGGGLSSRIDHNTIAENEAMGASWGVDCNLSSSIVARNNVVVSSLESGSAVTGSGCNWEYSNIQQDTGVLDGEGNLNVDAGFVAGVDDFHLDPGSDLVDAGQAIDDVFADRDGQPRVQGDAPDIGAYEVTP